MESHNGTPQPFAPGGHLATGLNILIAADHAMVRAGLRSIIDQQDGMQVVAEVADGAATLATLENLDCGLVLLDLSLPPPSGSELVGMIRTRHPRLPVLVVSMHDSPQIVSAAMCAGANGYISKDREPDQLLMAIRQVATGGTWLEPDMMQAVLNANKDVPALSNRERQVLVLLASGNSNQEIARTLFISEKTVSTHKTNLMRKLNLNSIADLIRYVDEKRL